MQRIPDGAEKSFAIIKDPVTDEWVGSTELYVCDSDLSSHEKQGHYGPVSATVLVHWVNGPCLKCPLCAQQLLAIAHTLGTHIYYELIQYPEVDALLAAHRKARAISLDGVPH